jgi:hypothetical protein
MVAVGMHCDFAHYSLPDTEKVPPRRSRVANVLLGP